MLTSSNVPGRSNVDTVDLGVAHLRRVSWAAIFAGMILAVVAQLVFSLLGAGIGMSTIDPLRFSSPDVATFGMGAAIWWAVSSVIALFIGGWVAAHLSGTHEKTDAILHGLLTWGLATLVSVYLITSAVSSVVRGSASVVGSAASMTASGATAAAGPLTEMAKQKLADNDVSVDSITKQVKILLAQTGKKDLQPGAIADQAAQAANQVKNGVNTTGQDNVSTEENLQAIMKRIMASGNNTVDQVDRDAAVNVVMNQAQISKQEAESRVDGWVKTYQQGQVKLQQAKVQAEQKAREVADATAKVSSQAALGMVVALLLGALGAAIGAASARRKVVVATGI